MRRVSGRAAAPPAGLERATLISCASGPGRPRRPDRMAGAYWPQPWTCEDGGPRRWGCADRQPGLGIRPGERLEVAARARRVRHRRAGAPRAGRAVRAAPRHPGARPAVHAGRGLGRAAGPAHARGHRDDPAAAGRRVLAGRDRGARQRRPAHGLRALGAPAERPTSTCSPRTACRSSGRTTRSSCSTAASSSRRTATRPAGREPSTVSVLDPETLLPVAPPLRLPEPSIARPGVGRRERGRRRARPPSSGCGSTAAAGRLMVDDRWRPRYGPAPGRSYGWDPVLTDEHVFWMDNGRNRVDRTMLGDGRAARPRAPVVGAPRRRGRALGARSAGCRTGPSPTRPPGIPARRIVVAYDAGNAVLRAWRAGRRRARAAVAPRRLRPRRPPDPLPGHARARRPGLAGRGRRCAGPPCAGRCGRRFQVLAQSAAARRASLRTGHDQLVVLDLDTGADKARVAVPSPVAGASSSRRPGFGRDVYYQSLTTIARVVVV